MGTHKTHKPHATERIRAAETLRLRLSGMTWEAIAAQLNYRSPGGPRMAVERLLGRIEAEAIGELRKIEGRRLDELQAAVWDKARAGDCDAIRTVLRISERRSKLLGLDAPVTLAVEGITEAEFARAAAELLAVTGDAPLRELAKLPPAPGEPVQDGYDPDWSNIGVDDAAMAAADSVPDEPADSAPDEPAAAAVVVERADDLDGDDGTEEAEVVVAELVPLSPGRRRIPAREIIDENGVPFSRGAIARRLGGYDPLRGWAPS
ncbi:hypothetical protein NJB1604_39400 [Mycobacterium marinum]|uniref:hypothetical protein n=1 Tax=Mycobacterium marinum TaxID=1781 RepID=UPI0021C46BA3|nr:hypothetical protein [Mycobacterium marinum]GJO51402.1 hypothetical protein NJB1604_39400 [Mycobacterium marinum]